MPLSVPGTPGTNGTNGKTVLSGTAAPTAAIGADGDFYLRTSNNSLYGPKTNGTWGGATSLVGPQGPQGPAGESGSPAQATHFSSLPGNPEAGRYYPIPNLGAVNTASLSSSAIYFTPFSVQSPPSPSVNTLGIEVTTGAGGSTLSFALYTCGANLLPAASWVFMGTVSSATAGRRTTNFSGEFLSTPGDYYLACWVQGSGGSPNVRTINGNIGPLPYLTPPGSATWSALVMTGQTAPLGSVWPDNPTLTGNALGPRYDFSVV